MADNSKVLGVVLLIRHGDRQGFYQNPNTYAASATALTALGSQQEYQLGQELRSLYIDSSSPSYIQGMSTGLFDQTEVLVRADAGGEGGVILNSAVSLVQGLWPATANYSTTLANGTTVMGPLEGYQPIPIESVEPTNDISLEGYTSCGTFDNATNAFYNSTLFKQKEDESKTFLSQLPSYLDGRPVTLQNMWNIFDFINVQNIHNAAFAKALPPTYLEQARDLANWHEYNIFTSPQPNGIGNIAGRAIMPTILNNLVRIQNASDPLKFVYQATAYKPFLSLFNMTGVAQAHPELAGIVNYAAAVALELRQPANGGEPVLRFQFKNGSDVDFVRYDFLNRTGDIPLSTFMSAMGPLSLNNTATWCNVCSNTKDRGCAAIAQASASAAASAKAVQSHDKISPLGAGFLGAGVALVTAAILLSLLACMGLLNFGRRSGSRKNSSSSVRKA